MATARDRNNGGRDEPFVVAPPSTAGPGRVDARTRTRLIWGGGGLLVGVLLTMLSLVVFGPRATFAPAGPPPASDLAVTVNDRYLTRLASEGAARASLPFTLRDVQAHIGTNNVVVITGRVDPGLGLPTATLTAQAQVYASGGTIALRNLSGSIGGLTLAGPIADVLQAAINQRIAAERQVLTQGNIHYAVVGVASAEGQLTLHLTFA